MKLITILFLIAFYAGTTSLCATETYSPAVGRLLHQLDSVLSQRDAYVKTLEAQVNRLKEETHRKPLDELQRYEANRKIYDLLCVFNADSAMVYVNENIDIARRMQLTDGMAEWKIRKSFLLAATGLLKESYDVLKGVKVEKAGRKLRMEYYTQAVYLYSHMAMYLAEDSRLRSEYDAKEMLFSDSLSRMSTPQDELYLWYKGWRYKNDATQRTQIIGELKQKLSHTDFDSRTDAMNAYVLAILSKLAGNRDDYLSYMICAGMADIRSANRDIASLEELAQALFELGDLDHAYAYISFCQQNALYYKNRVRVVSIANMQTDIWQAYQQRNRQQERSLHIYTVLITLLSAFLAGALLYIRRQMKCLSASQRQIKKANERLTAQMKELGEVHAIQEEANRKLKELNHKLKEMNASLEEANYIKEEYISQLFIFCSNYISKLDDYRKAINRKMKAGQYAEIARLTGSESMVQDELKEFYHNFDMIFLHLYPDFIDNFNALLQPAARFELKNGEMLNTQLRIYALVRLGINDSVKIAEFLHCSTQTVYNYRLKTRNNALIPKEDFAATVSRLGKIQL